MICSEAADVSYLTTKTPARLAAPDCGRFSWQHSRPSAGSAAVFSQAQERTHVFK